MNNLLEGWALFLALWFHQILQPRLCMAQAQVPLSLLVCHPHSPDSAGYSSAIEFYPEGTWEQLPWSQLHLLRVSGARLYFPAWGGPSSCLPLNLVHGFLSMAAGQVGHRDVVQPSVSSLGISLNFEV